MNYYINDFETISALGRTKKQHLDKLLSFDLERSEIPDFSINFVLPPMPVGLRHFESKNNRMILYCLQQLEESLSKLFKKIDKSRVGVIIGTSTSGLEDAITDNRSFFPKTLPESFNYSIQEMGSSSAFIQSYLGVGPICYNVSTACTSGTRSLIEARRMLALGLCDVIIVGGADSISDLTLQGFDCLEALSKQYTNPFSKNRDGINIGEAAAIFILSREKFLLDDTESFEVLGLGESSDSYHISSPDPSGKGAIEAMNNALKDAKISPEKIDYINLHGTGTEKNDAMEALAIDTLFSNKPFVSSTKPITGHTLGAAGALELSFLCLLLSLKNINSQGYSKLPIHWWDKQVDDSIKPIHFVEHEDKKVLNRCMSNSYAFGGNNVSVIIGKCHDH